MPFREKEPVRIGSITLPFIRRISETVLPNGHYMERVKSNWGSLEESGNFYQIDGEEVIAGWFDECMTADETVRIPGPQVNNHPYLNKLIAWTPSSAIINYTS